MNRRTASCSVSPPWTTCRQAAWALLRYCAAPRANYLLRVLPPGKTIEYARQHDQAVSGCLASLLGIADATLPDDALRTAQLAMRFGGLGLRSAQENRHAAYWASWRDTLPVIYARAPGVAARLLQAYNPLLRELLTQPSHLPSNLQPTYMPRGMRLPRGVKPARRQLETKTRIQISCVVGKSMRPRHVMSARLRRILGTWHVPPLASCHRGQSRSNARWHVCAARPELAWRRMSSWLK